jgi:hypothetical protein
MRTLAASLLILMVAGSALADPPASQPVVGLNRLVGQKVTLTGTFGGPGKIDDYITLNASEHVYFEGEMSGLSPSVGQRIRATGVLRYHPGSGPPRPHRPTEATSQPASPHYFFRAVEIAAADPPASQPTRSQSGEKRPTFEQRFEEALAGSQEWFWRVASLPTLQILGAMPAAVCRHVFAFRQAHRHPTARSSGHACDKTAVAGMPCQTGPGGRHACDGTAVAGMAPINSPINSRRATQ